MSDTTINHKDLTILSVNFKGKFFLDLNFACATALNNTGSLNWVIVENTPDDADGKLGLEDDRFKVVPGVEPPEVSAKVRASYHHGAALNKEKEHIKTRFALVLDPDFFIVRRGWIAEVLTFMVDNSLSFFGVPWHPRHYKKYRYFPCVHCLFIDLNRVSIEELDFKPDLINNPKLLRKSKFQTRYEQLLSQGHKARARWYTLLRPWAAIKQEIALRSLIGSSRDTGYHIFQRFGMDSNIRFKTTIPVFRSRKDTLLPSNVSKLQCSKVVEMMFPDRMCYIPKRKGYFTESGFRELGYEDVAYLGWEEFVWRGQPFGFHVRGFLQLAQNIEKARTSLIDTLINLTGLNLHRSQTTSKANEED